MTVAPVLLLSPAPVHEYEVAPEAESVVLVPAQIVTFGVTVMLGHNFTQADFSSQPV